MSRTLAHAARQAKTSVRFRTVRWQDVVQTANIQPVSDTDASTRSILLLDDDPDVGIAAQLLLQRRVAPVTCLRRPAELFAALDRLHPALLLLDLNFGRGRTDGAQGLHLLDEVFAQTRTRTQTPVVVVLTAYADIELAVQALKRGAFDFIVKPWDNVRLIAACREALRHASHSVDEHAQQSAALTEPVRSLAAQERATVMAAMTEAQGNLSAAARALGLSRPALYRRLQKYGF
jgi:two-component system, response regulator RegA